MTEAPLTFKYLEPYGGTIQCALCWELLQWQRGTDIGALMSCPNASCEQHRLLGQFPVKEVPAFVKPDAESAT